MERQELDEKHVSFSSSKLLSILQGLPVSGDMMSAELVQTYKCCQSFLIENPGSSDNVHKVAHQLQITLKRVLQSSHTQETSPGDIAALLKNCLDSCTADTVMELGLVTLAALMLPLADTSLGPAYKIQLLQLLLSKIDEFSLMAGNNTVMVEIGLLSGDFLPLEVAENEHDEAIVCLRFLTRCHLAITYAACGKLENSSKCLQENSRHTSLCIAYMKAFVAFKLGRMREAKCILQTSFLRKKHVDEHAKLRLWNLCACILANEDHQRSSAINMFEKCLTKEFDLIPLFNMSLVYRSMNLVDQELEILETELSKTATASPSVPCQDLMVDPVLCLGRDEMKINSAQRKHPVDPKEALYYLARRCCELKRYNQGSANYLQLLNKLKGHPLEQKLRGGNESILYYDIPTTAQIFLETASALLLANNFEESIEICSQYLNIYDREDDVPCSKGRKRLHSDDDTEYNDDPLRMIQRRMILCKVDGLMLMNKMDEALVILESLQETENDEANHTEQQASKRTKFESEAPKGREVGVKSDSLDFLKEGFRRKIVILVIIGRNEDALKSSMGALQRFPEDVSVVHNHCVLLMKLGREPECAEIWTKHRGLDSAKEDVVMLECLLNRRQYIFMSGITTEDSTPWISKDLDKQSLLNMDIVALKIKLRQVKETTKR